MTSLGGNGAAGPSDHAVYHRLETQVTELSAQVAQLTAVVARLAGDGQDADTVHDDASKVEGPPPPGDDTPPSGTSVGWRRADDTVRTGPVDCPTRVPSDADVVDEVCNAIVGSSWQTPVHLSGIDWQVLDVVDDEDGRRALLLSDQVVASGPYHSTCTQITWDQCDLRSWLNHEFCALLGAPLVSRVLWSQVDNDPNPIWGTGGGTDTTDQVFLLSLEEVARYLEAEDDVDWEKCQTQSRPKSLQTGQRGKAEYDDGGSAWWWLRSSGGSPGYAAFVRADGNLDDGAGRDVSSVLGGIRPAFWMDLQT